LISNPSQRSTPTPRGTPAPASTDSTRESVDTEKRQTEATDATRGLVELEVARIDPNPDQPRRDFDEGALAELARSIGEHGVLQPIVVRRAGERYELVMGERRFRASRKAGLERVPAVVLEVAPADRLELAIVENVQREDLNPMELAHAYQALASAGHTQEEIGRKVSKDRSSIANQLRLLELSPAIQADVEGGRLAMGHAKALLQVSDPTARAKLRDRIVQKSLSVREAERLARELEGDGRPSRAGTRKSADAAPALDADTRAYVERLERRLQTRVTLHPGANGGGRLEIRYFDLEDLERIGGLLLGEAG
jgi:ParB family chromosome partitioning protein